MFTSMHILIYHWKKVLLGPENPKPGHSPELLMPMNTCRQPLRKWTGTISFLEWLAGLKKLFESGRSWQEKAPGRFTGGVYLGEDGLPEPSVDSLQILAEEGVFSVLGELGLQYHGISPDTPDMAPYYAKAAELGMPVALHTGLGPPGGPHTFAPEFRITLGRPSLFEPVLVRHPNLKAYMMHAGWPYISETIALMYVYPDLYADIGVLSWALPRETFYDTLRPLINAGFGERLLFGTDQMLWPEAVGLAVETMENVPFLTAKQRRDIFYNNAARFLELSEEEIVNHHGK